MSAVLKSRATSILASADAGLLLGRVIQFGSQLVLVALIPLALTPEAFVSFSLLIPLAAIGVSAAFGWLNSTVHRYVHELVDDDLSELRETLAAYYIGAGIILTLGLVLAASMSATLYALLPWLVFALAIKNLVLGALNMLRRSRLFVAANLGYGASLTVFVCLCFLKGDAGLWYNTLLYGGLDIAISIYVLSQPDFLKFGRFPRFSPSSVRRCLTYGAPLVLNGFAVWIISLSDRYMLNYWATSAETATYILTYQLAASAITVPMSLIVSITYPRILELEKREGRTAALTFNRVLFRYFLWSVIPILVVATSVVLIAIEFLYSEYLLLPLVATIVVLAHLVSAMSHFVNKEFELSGRTIVLTRGVAAGAVVNVALNLALIPAFGGTGAAIATLCAYGTVVATVFAAGTFRYSPAKPT